jgi:predicted ATPase
MDMLTSLTLSGYKSIRHISLQLRQLNVLIGANGAGKSNLISFLDLLRSIGQESLQYFVSREGGANATLHWSAKRTQQIRFSVEYDAAEGEYTYSATLRYAAGDTLIFDEERCTFRVRPDAPWSAVDLGRGHKETRLAHGCGERPFPWAGILNLLHDCRTYHFHDTSQTAAVRQTQAASDSVRLNKDAGNLAALLHRLHETEGPFYRRIVETIRQVAPWFRDFCLEPQAGNEKFVRLDWRGEDPDVVFTPHQLPDGALRAMALIALLLQPKEYLPQVLVIDEPELGLHPFAINVVASLLEAVSHHSQVIVATQSVPLLEQFDPEDVVVVDREEGASTFKPLRSEDLQDWLEDYSLGELWQKNVIGGGPA